MGKEMQTGRGTRAGGILKNQEECCKREDGAENKVLIVCFTCLPDGLFVCLACLSGSSVEAVCPLRVPIRSNPSQQEPTMTDFEACKNPKIKSAPFFTDILKIQVHLLKSSDVHFLSQRMP